jgi:hypothetical protein
MKKLILAVITLGLLSCEKEEVTPVDLGTQPPLITNHVEIVINDLEVGDSLKVISGNYSSLVRVTIPQEIDNFSCNAYNNFNTFLEAKGDCNTNTFELIGTDNIQVETNADIDVVYK